LPGCSLWWRFSAASVNHGTASKDVYSERFLAGTCPVFGTYGAKDRANKGTGERLERILTAVGVDHSSRHTAMPATLSCTITTLPISLPWQTWSDEWVRVLRAIGD
jgi:hypothetical protein